MQEKNEIKPESTKSDTIEDLIAHFAENEPYATICPPVSDKDLAHCIKSLKAYEMELPNDYIHFLKICNGFYFDGTEFFGTHSEEPTNDLGTRSLPIVINTYSFNSYFYVEDYIENPMLCIGRTCTGDYLVYNPQTCTYQLLDHEDACATVWQEDAVFGKFFAKVILGLED